MLAAILPPIVPRPMKPTCMFASKSWPGVARCRLVLLVLFENGLCDAGGCHRGWPSGVEGQVRDDFADLVLGHAVGQGASDMAAELLRSVKSCQHRDSNKTAVALGESGTFPDITKENLVRDIHQFRHHGAKCFPRIRCRHVYRRPTQRASVSPFSGGACPALRGVVAAPFFHLSACFTFPRGSICYAHVADSFARSAFGSASVVAAPSLLASDQADYAVARIAVHAGLISNGAILSAGGQEACGIRLALRIVRSFVAGRRWPVRGGQASSRLCPGEYSSQ